MSCSQDGSNGRESARALRQDFPAIPKFVGIPGVGLIGEGALGRSTLINMLTEKHDDEKRARITPQAAVCTSRLFDAPGIPKNVKPTLLATLPKTIIFECPQVDQASNHNMAVFFKQAWVGCLRTREIG